MNLFNHKHKLKKYNDVYEIIDDFYLIRMAGYHKRKKYLLDKLEQEAKKLSNRARFILEQCNDTIDLRKKKKNEVIQLLKDGEYDILDGDQEYKYLREMRIEQVEEENMNKLLKERDAKIKELNILKKTKPKTIWKRELAELLKEFEKYKTLRKLKMYGRNKD